MVVLGHAKEKEDDDFISIYVIPNTPKTPKTEKKVKKKTEHI